MSSLPMTGAGPSAADPLSSYLVYDTFTDTNGTTLDSHTPEKDSVLGGWSDVDAGITIESNKASDNDVKGLAVIDAGAADVIVEVTVIPQDGGNGFNGVCARYQDATHFIIAGLDALLNKVTIWVNNGGSWSEKTGNANSSFAVVEGQSYDLKVVLSGDSWEVFVDDVSKGTASIATFNTETEYGLYNDAAGGGVDATKDNFSITSN